MGNGRSLHLIEDDSRGILLAFRRPIEREHVENGCLIQPSIITREGRKRMAVVPLDEASAEAAYKLLRAWHEERMRRQFFLSFFLRMVAIMHRKPFLKRWLR
jgi:hypothetical protein